ncbi:MAG: hypothetical protein GY948_24500, partial [Alphaproteobacteria bacterium]|nr:hypothetical protein [Alphaproteobacteria bacterium]
MAGPSNIFHDPRLASTSKGMKFRGSCQLSPRPSPSSALGLGRTYDQGRWDERKKYYASIKKLVINLDNGPSASSHRTQFIKRITEFAIKNKIAIHLAYYPPYHSKYNPVERCWGVLERHWNGDIL